VSARAFVIVLILILILVGVAAPWPRRLAAQVPRAATAWISTFAPNGSAPA
jgi:hypothetical protein